MAHDVFISHAYKDRSVAEAICEKLESAGLRCWMAPRNISAGEDWTKAIRNAIESARALVLVFSDNANGAPHIEREIANAFYTGRAIISFRLTTALPRREFLFYLSDARWYDAASQPAEQHLEILAAGVNGLLAQQVLANRERLPANATTLKSGDSWIDESGISRFRIPRIAKYVAVAVPIVGVVWLFWVAAQQSDSPQEGNGSQLRRHGGTVSQNGAVGSESIPHYTFTRLGLWAAASPTPAALVQPADQNVSFSSPAVKSVTADGLPSSSPASVDGSANANDLPPSKADQVSGSGDVNDEQAPAVSEPGGNKTKPNRSARLINHHGQHQRAKPRAKSHKRRVAKSENGWLAKVFPFSVEVVRRLKSLAE
jgi:hypothetical protein